MGLCFERLGKTNEAVDYYKKALIEDPNNLIVKEKLDDINRKNQRKSIYEQFEQKNQLEEEKGERIPLPVNKSEYDISLDEENLEKIPIYSGETGQD
jgi:tetratricopeptide (TPR) repeat protein